jgi:hexosaminidase
MNSLIPLPNKSEYFDGYFEIDSATRICVDDADSQAVTAGCMLAEYLGHSRDAVSVLESDTGGGLPLNNFILLSVGKRDENSSAEGYKLDVLTTHIHIAADGCPGLFYAVQTLLQLASDISKHEKNGGGKYVPCCRIDDSPRFGWRGMMLDVSRHFFSMSFLKRYIDLIASYKLNTLHLHLSDDQGWRLEIKSHPELIKHGAWRDEAGKRYGGFYTQDEMRNLVSYARRRFVRIIPEIDVPGHSLAAIASNPELSCTGESFKPWTSAGISKDICCAGKEETFHFFEDVFREVADIFPDSFIHIGGDEAPRKRWEDCPRCQERIAANGLADEAALQTYFMQRISSFIKSFGRDCIAWDDILEGGAPDGTTVMFWRDGTQGHIKALDAGLNVIMSPTTHCYFDYKQDDTKDEPGEIGVVTLESAYAFDPAPNSLTPEQSSHVLGGQANLWTEAVHTPADVEYMTLPRLCALSEAVWTHREKKCLSGFMRRLEAHDMLFADKGFNARRMNGEYSATAGRQT